MSDDDEDMKILDQKQKDSGDSSDEDELAKPVFSEFFTEYFADDDDADEFYDRTGNIAKKKRLEAQKKINRTCGNI